MSFEEFLGSISTEVQGALGKESIVKMMCDHEDWILQIQIPETATIESYNISELYDMLSDEDVETDEFVDRAVDYILSDLDDMIDDDKESLEVASELINDYEYAKNYLYIHIVPNSDIQKIREEVDCHFPYTTFLDLSVIYMVAFPMAVANRDNDHGMIVSEDLLDMWGITILQLHEDAVKNAALIKPTACDLLMYFNDGRCIYGLTNASVRCGLSCMLYPGYFRTVSDQKMHGGDMYIVPFHVDGVMIFPCDDMTLDEVKAYMDGVYAIIEGEQADFHRLFNRIYKYDALTDRIEFADDTNGEGNRKFGKIDLC